MALTRTIRIHPLGSLGSTQIESAGVTNWNGLLQFVTPQWLNDTRTLFDQKVSPVSTGPADHQDRLIISMIL
jgi:hypothetical protein